MPRDLPQSDLPEIEAIFDEIVVISDPALQQSTLSRRCNGDLSIYERVQALLHAYSRSGFLESSAAEVVASGNFVPSLCGEVVGKYELVELLASGGMGEVYMARDTASPHAYFAFKLLAADWNTRHGQTRFALEQDLLRKLDHPGIVRLMDTGQTTDGRPYLVMELVRGLPIDQFCDRAELALDKRMELIIQTCQAMQHVHDSGIVHRDLKPSNILVQPQDGRPQIKIIDFGVAKHIGARETVAASLTSVEQILGTPAYMSPEQLDWSADVSAQSDIYSMGAVLCKLLIGITPLDARLQPKPSEDNADRENNLADVLDIQKLRQALLQDEPRKPSRILTDLPADESEAIARKRSRSLSDLQQKLHKQLDWVVLKALCPQRSDRYLSATALSADLQAVLDHRPTTAGPPSIIDRMSKWSRRDSHWLKNAAIGCLLIGNLLGFWWASSYRERFQSESTTKARQQRLTQRALVQKQFVADLRQAAIATRTGDEPLARRILEKYQGNNESSQFDTFAYRYLSGLVIPPKRIPLSHEEGVLNMDLSPDSSLLATCDRSGQINIHSTAHLGDTDGQPLAQLKPARKEVTIIRFSPDGKLLASTGQEGIVRLWSTETWECLRELRCYASTLNSLGWSPQGLYLAAGDRNGRLIVWDATTFERINTLPDFKGHVRAIAWSPDGSRLAVAAGEHVSLIDTQSWKSSGSIHCGAGVLAVEFSTDGTELGIGGYFPELLCMRVETMEIVQRIPVAPGSAVWSIHFLSLDSMVIGAANGKLRYLRRNGKEKQWMSVRDTAVADSNNRIRQIASHPDSKSLFAVLEESRQIVQLELSSLTGFERIAASQAALLDPDLVQRISKRYLKALSECRPIFNTNVGLVALAGTDDEGSCVGLYELSTGNLVRRLRAPSRVRELQFSPDGRCLSIFSPERFEDTSENSKPACLIHHIDRNKTHVLPWPVDDAESLCVFADNGNLLIAGGMQSRQIGCIDTQTGSLLRTVTLSSNFVSLNASRDGKQALIGQLDRLSCYSADLSVPLWCVSSPETVIAIGECLDGRTVAFVGFDGKIRLIDKETREMLFELAAYPDDPGPLLRHQAFYWFDHPEPNTLIFCGLDMAESIRFSAPHAVD